MKRHIELVDVPRALSERFGVSASYWQVYKLVIDARVSAVRDGRRWVIPEAELAQVAEAVAPKAA